MRWGDLNLNAVGGDPSLNAAEDAKTRRTVTEKRGANKCAYVTSYVVGHRLRIDCISAMRIQMLWSAAHME